MIDRRRTRLVTAALLIAVPVVFNLFFALLQAGFDYPDILRRPPTRCCAASPTAGKA